MDGDMIFVILITAISCGFLLALAKMIINAVKWHTEQKQHVNESVGLAELEAVIQRTIQEANARLDARLDQIESRLDRAALPEPLLDVEGEEPSEPVREKTVGRAVRSG